MVGGIEAAMKASMTKKDFQAMAHMLGTVRGRLLAEGYDRGVVLRVMDLIITTMAQFCAERNPRFDYNRFIESVKG